MSGFTEQTRHRAKQFLAGQRITDQAFAEAVNGHINTITVEQLRPCPSCESALCGICGGCHQLDKEFLWSGPNCPAEQETSGKTPCVAWSWAYLFLRKAERS